MNFNDIPLHSTLQTNLNGLGLIQPTEVQQQAIDVILNGNDALVCAKTGTGKTYAFALPLLHFCLTDNSALEPFCCQHLILTPTRELAEQVASSIELLINNTDITVATAYGGVSIKPQKEKLKHGVNILVATPGRLLDLARTQSVKLSSIKSFTLDEADRMLDLGFKDELIQVTKRLPSKKQVLLFSATFSAFVKTFAYQIVDQAIEIEVSPSASVVSQINEEFFALNNLQKSRALAYLIGSRNYRQVIVFMRQKSECDQLVKELKKDGIKAASLHGDRSQGARNRALEQLKNNEIRALIATDVAARGLDIPQLPAIFNFQLPFKVEDYVHRIGRTGRAGESGHAITFVSQDDEFRVDELERLLDKRITPAWLSGFEPNMAEFDSSEEKKKRKKNQSAKAKARAKASFSVKRRR